MIPKAKAEAEHQKAHSSRHPGTLSWPVTGREGAIETASS